MHSKFDHPYRSSATRSMPVARSSGLRARLGRSWMTPSDAEKDEKIAGPAKSRFAAGQARWSLFVNPETEKRFKNGTAQAAGMVCAYGDAVSIFQWEDEIECRR